MRDGRSIAIWNNNILSLSRHLSAWLPTDRNRDHNLNYRHVGGSRLGGESQGVKNLVSSHSHHHQCHLLDLRGRHSPR